MPIFIDFMTFFSLFEVPVNFIVKVLSEIVILQEEKQEYKYSDQIYVIQKLILFFFLQFRKKAIFNLQIVRMLETSSKNGDRSKF